MGQRNIMLSFCGLSLILLFPHPPAGLFFFQALWSTLQSYVCCLVPTTRRWGPRRRIYHVLELLDLVSLSLSVFYVFQISRFFVFALLLFFRIRYFSRRPFAISFAAFLSFILVVLLGNACGSKIIKDRKNVHPWWDSEEWMCYVSGKYFQWEVGFSCTPSLKEDLLRVYVFRPLNLKYKFSVGSLLVFKRLWVE